MTALLTQPVPIDAPQRPLRVACSHCVQPVPRGLIEDGAELQFCCAGCRTVYETIHACGLDAYYRLREISDDEAKPASHSGREYAAFDSEAFLATHTQPLPGGLRSVDLLLENVHCAACVWLVEKLPRVAEGVVESRLSLREAVVRVRWDPQAIPLSRITRSLDRLGYPPHPARGGTKRGVRQLADRKQLIRLAIAGACAGNTMLLALALYAGMFGGIEREYETFFRWISMVIGVISLAWPGSVFFRGGLAAIRTRTPNLDLPIAIALLVGGVAGAVNVVLDIGDIYYDSLSVLVFLLLVGRYLQSRQQRWAADSVELMLALTPVTCRIVRGDGVVESPIETVGEGDVVEVRSGDVFPTDGVVVQGLSTVNRALLTGESAAVAAGLGDLVYAGTQNVGSTLRVRVTVTGGDTRVARLMGLVERGVQTKPPIVQFADRIAGYFLVVVSIIAAVVFAGWSIFASVEEAVTHTVGLLIVACPCALGLATPLTMAVATGRAAKRDILIKDAAALEKLARHGRLLLDKTGTLTRGRATLLEWIGPDALKPIVAEAERQSQHPVGKALVEALGLRDDVVLGRVEERGDGGVRTTLEDGRELLVGSPRYAASHGATPSEAQRDVMLAHQAKGHTVVLVAVGREVIALAALGDKLHDGAADAIRRLRRLGWRPAIVSGDAAAVVRKTGADAGLRPDESHGDVDPEAKLAWVRDRAGDAGGVTIMVGDGVNDAAALAAADVGVAVHGGAEASLAAADVYVGRPGVEPIVELIELGRRTVAVARRNLCVSLGYNALAISLAAAGLINPLVAAVLMPLSSGTVLALAVGSFVPILPRPSRKASR